MLTVAMAAGAGFAWVSDFLNVPPQEKVWEREALAAPHEQPDKAARVQRMFNAIAPRYELVNRVFSAGRDAAWRRKAVKLAEVTKRDEVLDVACGTGDFARAFAAAKPAMVVGCDFAPDMLLRAVDVPGFGIHWCEADALQLPFRDESFSIVSCAFGIRNFADLDRGLAEMSRVLRPAGRLIILEFTRPANRFVRAVYELYANRIMPPAAAVVSGDRTGAYQYLRRSVESFLTTPELIARLERTGFRDVECTPLNMGAVTIYRAVRSSS